jgi:di/tricarboxylate transporter
MLFGFEALAPVVMGALLVALFAAFALEISSPDVIAIGLVAILLVLKIISTNDVLAAMSNPAPLTIASLFVISSALVRTGALDAFATHITGLAGHSRTLSIVLLLGSISVLAAFTNTTPLVTMMIPIGITLARNLRMAPSKLLIPISFAAILGGTCTLLGTSTNLLVDGVARRAGLPPFSIFDIAPVGAPVAVVGLLWLVIGDRLLPDRLTVAGLTSTGSNKRFVVSIFIEPQSPYIGLGPREIDLLARGDRQLVDVIRGDASLRRSLDDCVLEEGDILVVRTSAADLMTMKQQGRLALTPESSEPHLVPLSSRNSVLVETLLAPGAAIIGHKLGDLRLRRRYGVYPIALHRRGANLQERFEAVPLQVGDTLLIEGAPEDLQRLVDDQQLVNIAEPSTRPFRRGKAPVAIAVVPAIVIAAAFHVMPLAGLSVLGVAIVLGAGCVEPDEAFKSVQWRIVALVVAMLAIASGLENTGLVQHIVGFAKPFLDHQSPWVALASIYLLSLVLTELVTHSAVGAVMTPIAISLAHALHVNPRGFVVAVMFAASASFLTPIGYQTNTLVYGAGGYRFSDFFKFGLPLTLIVSTTTLILIPMLWPL